MPSVTSRDLISFVQDNFFCIEKIASRLRLDEIDLKTNVLLYLPRIVKNNLPDVTTYEREVERVGRILEQRQRPYLHLAEPPVITTRNIRNFRLIELSELQAKVFHERFHYVGSYRKNSMNFGLAIPDTDKLACFASISPFDIGNLVSGINQIVAPETVVVLSRFFAFRWAPRNCFSFMFRKVLGAVRAQNRNINAVVTYLNKNLGFGGTSYNPSEWKLLALEEGTSYSYVDEKYMTVRDLLQTFGTFDKDVLRQNLGPRFETSVIDLQPLEVLIYTVNKRGFVGCLPEKPFLLRRPEHLGKSRSTI